jgi:hypothetical protein
MREAGRLRFIAGETPPLLWALFGLQLEMSAFSSQIIESAGNN